MSWFSRDSEDLKTPYFSRSISERGDREKEATFRSIDQWLTERSVSMVDSFYFRKDLFVSEKVEDSPLDLSKNPLFLKRKTSKATATGSI